MFRYCIRLAVVLVVFVAGFSSTHGVAQAMVPPPPTTPTFTTSTATSTLPYISPQLLASLLAQIKFLQQYIENMNASTTGTDRWYLKNRISHVITVDYLAGTTSAEIIGGDRLEYNTTSTDYVLDRLIRRYVQWTSDSSDYASRVEAFKNSVRYEYKNSNVVVRYELEIWSGMEMYFITRMANGSTTRNQVPHSFIEDLITMNYYGDVEDYQLAVKGYVHQVDLGERPKDLMDMVGFLTSLTPGQLNVLFVFDTAHYVYVPPSSR